MLVPPPPEFVPELMSDLNLFIHGDEPYLTPVIKAGLVHAQLETIHPFLDGNDRVGRILIALMLCSSGILSRPTLYPSLCLKVHRAHYYNLLQRVHTHDDWTAWLDFFLDGIAPQPKPPTQHGPF